MADRDKDGLHIDYGNVDAMGRPRRYYSFDYADALTSGSTTLPIHTMQASPEDVLELVRIARDVADTGKRTQGWQRFCPFCGVPTGGQHNPECATSRARRLLLLMEQRANEPAAPLEPMTRDEFLHRYEHYKTQDIDKVRAERDRVNVALIPDTAAGGPVLAVHMGRFGYCLMLQSAYSMLKAIGAVDDDVYEV